MHCQNQQLEKYLLHVKRIRLHNFNPIKTLYILFSVSDNYGKTLVMCTIAYTISILEVAFEKEAQFEGDLTISLTLNKQMTK